MTTKKNSALNTGAINIEDAVVAGKKTIEQTVSVAKENVEKASTAALKSYDEAADLNKSNLNVFVEAANIWTKGFEDISKAYFTFTQSTVTNTVNAGQVLLGAKTVNEALELQGNLARSNVDLLIAESSKLSEMSYKVTNDALAPIQSHVNETFGKFSKIAA